MPKIKNIIIFIAIAVVFILIYIYFIKPDSDTATLISSNGSSAVPAVSSAAPVLAANPQITQDFLNLLLSIKSIKLNDAIFSDSAFISLHDSSITLVPDGNEGRSNPFAPIGVDNIALPTNTGGGAQAGSGALP